MEDRILTSVKKALGIAETYDAFDIDIIMLINSAFSTLNQLGVGPEDGFSIVGDEEVWVQFTEGDAKLNLVQSYVVMKVRMLFDPPTTGYLISATEKQIAEAEWRLNSFVDFPKEVTS